MAQGIVRDRVIGALHEALRRAKEKGELRAEPFPALTVDLPK